jgi:hypothetical protein
VKATAFGYNSMVATVNVVHGSTNTVNFSLSPTLIATNFESGVGGWVVTGNATANSKWALGDPQPTGGGTVQTGDDHTPSPGVNAWITGLAGGNVGDNDVDGPLNGPGTTTLTSRSSTLWE